jgi:hypothetical protein
LSLINRASQLDAKKGRQILCTDHDTGKGNQISTFEYDKQGKGARRRKKKPDLFFKK